MSEATCKGDWSIWTACGQCSRCRETALEAARQFQEEKRAARKLKVSAYAGTGVIKNGDLQSVAFDEPSDAEDYAKRIWSSGVMIEIVSVRVVQVTNRSHGAGLE